MTKDKLNASIFVTVLSNGSLTHSEVRTFLHKDGNKIVTYKIIKTLDGSLALSKNHLVFSRRTYNDTFKPM